MRRDDVMAIVNGNFRGEIEGNTIYNYSGRMNYEIEDIDKRKELVLNVLNIDDNGFSRDKFWYDVWDMGICKTALNKTDALWTDTNIATVLEQMGTYLISSYNKEVKRYSRPTKEVEINDTMSNDMGNDKNYRLAPPEDVHACDYKMREIFSKDYSYYRDVIYVREDNKMKDRIKKSNIDRYGDTGEDFLIGYSKPKLKTEDDWDNLKRLELSKIELLSDAKRNHDVLKRQLKRMQSGERLLFHESSTLGVYKHEFMSRTIPCHKQLERVGIDSTSIKKIEEKLYSTKDKNLGVGLNHIMDNLKSVKDYMIQCKLAYVNRVCIVPDKCASNREVLNYIDYKNPEHVEALLYIPESRLDPDNDMSVLSYDISFMLKMLYEFKLIDEKDLQIVEGLRYRITDARMAEELKVNKKTIQRRRKKIIDCIITLNK